MAMTANSQAPVQPARRAALLNYFSLFSSFSTLI
jgi:mercuric ion transport protein